MIRVGNYGFVIGLILTIVSLIIGFGAMFSGYNNVAKWFLMLIPIGFMLLFFGLSIVILFSPAKEGKS